MPALSLLLASLGLWLAGAQAPPASPPSFASLPTPITVQFQTAVDFPGVLAGQRVRVPDIAIKHVLGPRLLIAGMRRIYGVELSYQPFYRYDKLLVLLPAAATLTPGQVITVTGQVRTVAAARASGIALDQELQEKKAAKKMRWMDKKLVLVADSVEMVDGSAIAAAR